MPLDNHYDKIKQTQKQIINNLKLADSARLQSLSTDFKIQNTLNTAQNQYKALLHRTQTVLARKEKLSRRHLEILDDERERCQTQPTGESEFNQLFPDEFVGDSKLIRQKEKDFYSNQQSKKQLQKTSEYEQLLKNIKSSDGKLYESYVKKRNTQKYTHYSDFLIDMDQLSVIDQINTTKQVNISQIEVCTQRRDRLAELTKLQPQNKTFYRAETESPQCREMSQQEIFKAASKLQLFFQLTGFFNKLKQETINYLKQDENTQQRQNVSKYQSHLRMMRFLEDYQNVPGLKPRK
ncbi:hypothetical protein SS50377_22013 [Spironucleus salmonicida]|uniref:Uncharacterized protein n=1 Tax=Spironucleus salmonicida TaxID=348837 RepID=V6LMA1_9EUKA|nr:hypothetical protein SS50377_22013 [Spironucleus salmonicida]|eukprot:EST45822.1 Hypothetical protein SS50377_14397 [Spironucleus salmonicida]